jgi:hypothetical protein
MPTLVSKNYFAWLEAFQAKGQSNSAIKVNQISLAINATSFLS